MAAEASSQTTEALSIPVLKNQSANLVLCTDPNLYPQPIVALVECLKASVLGHALTYAPAIPAALVHRAHYTSNELFDTNNNVKSVFYEAIDSRGKTKKEMVIPTAEQLVDMFNAMGYERQLETISTFKKKQLPDLWRFWAIVVDAYYKQIGFVYDPDFLEMKHTHITVPPLDEVLAEFCAQIPQEMLVKVSMDCNEVNTYRNTLVIPYLVRKITPAAPSKAPAKAKIKKKTIGGTSDSERTPSANIQAEEEEEQQHTSPIHETRPPTPPHITHPPPPPPTTAPPTATITSEHTTTIQTTTSEVSPTTAPQTSTIHTTETPPTSSIQTTAPIPSIIENPIISYAQTSEPISTTSEPLLNISSSEVDKSLPDFPFDDDFDFETTTISKPPSTEETVAAFHMAPLTIVEEDDSLDDSDFILGKQYKILNRKLDALLQSNTGFDPLRGTEVNLEDQMAEAQKALIDKMEKMVKDSEKTILDHQIEINSVMEEKFNTAVEQIDERHKLLKEETEKNIKNLVAKMEASNSEVVKALTTLNENTNSFNSQYQTNFAKDLSDAHKRLEELTAEQSHSAVTIFANELKKTNAAIASDIIEKLRRTLQPMINVSLKMERSQATRQAGPTFGTTTTTEVGGSSSRPQGNVLRIAPHMEQVYKEREEDYRKMLMINNISHENQTWTVELITAIGFNDFSVFNRLPLLIFETKSRISRQLDLPYNPKTFAFLQFERNVPKEKLTDFKKRKVTFHAKFIQGPNYVWSEKKIVKIISIKEGETFVGFKNIDFFVLRGINEDDSRFSIADFPIMNPHDFIVLLDLLKYSSRNEAKSISVFTDAFKPYLLLLQELHDEIGQVVNKPWGVVFKGLSSDSETMVTKFFEIDYKGLYPSKSIEQVLAHVNNCFVNTAEEKKKVKEYLNWWLQVHGYGQFHNTPRPFRNNQQREVRQPAVRQQHMQPTPPSGITNIGMQEIFGMLVKLKEVEDANSVTSVFWA
ncbi:hypothetical protein L2E82_29706 [Cichorium intybus]|uniref:Uncharacterized protein n=1 Tax=Cichorium intybus TaxID=13427 RepID=A0ACB9CYN7_CICIN|nr:hypothetical protein L2E82_29706 [Cichorium intybus]